MAKLPLMYLFGICVLAHSSIAAGFAPPSTSTRFASATTSPGISTLVADATKAESSESIESHNVQSVLGADVDQAVTWLDEALGFNSTAAAEIMNTFNGLQNEKSMDEAANYVNNLLAYVDGSDDNKKLGLPWWSRIRLLSRFSRRARRASLRRVLDLSTPTSEEKESIGEDSDAERRRRRRSLLILIRSLASIDDDNADDGTLAITRNERVPAISQLERAARREAKSMVTSEDMANRLPPGLETPRYSVLLSRPASKGGYEVRRYEPFSVCSVAMNKPRPVDSGKTDANISNPQLAGASSFGALAGYLFGKNTQKTSMKMTTPVLSEGEGEDRSMSFVLPSEYWKDGGLDDAPKPLQESGVTLRTKGKEDRAVVMFGGFSGKKDVKKRTKQLLDGLSKDKEWAAVPDAGVTLAQYNDPFTPPWKRRNEVSIQVESQ